MDDGFPLSSYQLPGLPRPRVRAYTPRRPSWGGLSYMPVQYDPLDALRQIEESRRRQQAEEEARQAALRGDELARMIRETRLDEETGGALDWILGSAQKPQDILKNSLEGVGELFSGDLGDAAKAFGRAAGSAIPFSESILSLLGLDDAVGEALAPESGLGTARPLNTAFGSRIRGRDIGAGIGMLLGETPTNTDPNGSLFSEFGESGIQDAGTIAGIAGEVILDPLNFLFGAGAASKGLKASKTLASALPQIAATRALKDAPDVLESLLRAGLKPQDYTNSTMIRTLLGQQGMKPEAIDAFSELLRRNSDAEVLRLFGAGRDAQAQTFREVYGEGNPILKALATAEEAADQTGATSLIAGRTFREQGELGQRTLLGGPLGMGQLNRPFVETFGALAKRFMPEKLLPKAGDLTNEQAVLGALTGINRAFGAGSELFKGADEALRLYRLDQINADEAADRLHRLGVTDMANLLSPTESKNSLKRRLAIVGGAAAIGGMVGDTPGAVLGGVLGLTMPNASRAATDTFRGAFLQDADSAAIQKVALLTPQMRAQVGSASERVTKAVKDTMDQTLAKAKAEGRFNEQEFFRDVAIEVEVGSLRAAAQAGDPSASKTLGEVLSDLKARLANEQADAAPRPQVIESIERQIARIEMDGITDPYEDLIREQARNYEEGQRMIADFRRVNRAVVNELAGPLGYFARAESEEFALMLRKNPKLARAWKSWDPTETRIQVEKTTEGADAAARKHLAAQGFQIPQNVRIFETSPAKSFAASIDKAEKAILSARMFDEVRRMAGSKVDQATVEAEVNRLRRRFSAGVEQGREHSFTRVTGGPELPEATPDFALEVARAVRSNQIPGVNSKDAFRIVRAFQTGNITPEIQQLARDLAARLRERAPREPVIEQLNKILDRHGIYHERLRSRVTSADLKAEEALGLVDDRLAERSRVPASVEKRVEKLRTAESTAAERVAQAATVRAEQEAKRLPVAGAAPAAPRAGAVEAAQQWLDTFGKRLESGEDVTRAEVAKSNWRAFMSHPGTPDPIYIWADAILTVRDPDHAAKASARGGAIERAGVAGETAAQGQRLQSEAAARKTAESLVRAVRDHEAALTDHASARVAKAAAEGDMIELESALREYLERVAVGFLGSDKTIQRGATWLARELMEGRRGEDVLRQALDTLRSSDTEAATEARKRLTPTRRAALGMLDAMEGKSGRDAMKAALAVEPKGVPANSPLLRARRAAAKTSRAADARRASAEKRAAGEAGAVERTRQREIKRAPSEARVDLPPKPNPDKVLAAIRAATPQGETAYSILADTLESALRSGPKSLLGEHQAKSAKLMVDEVIAQLPTDQAKRASTFVAESLRVFNKTPEEALQIVQRYRSLSPQTRSIVARLLEKRRAAGVKVPKAAKEEADAAEALVRILEDSAAVEKRPRPTPDRIATDPPPAPKVGEGVDPAQVSAGIDAVAEALARADVDIDGNVRRVLDKIVARLGGGMERGGEPDTILATVESLIPKTAHGVDGPVLTEILDDLGLDPDLASYAREILELALPVAREKLQDAADRAAARAANTQRLKDELATVYGGSEAEAVRDALADAEFVRHAGPLAADAMWEAHKLAVTRGRGAGQRLGQLTGPLAAQVEQVKKQIEEQTLVLDALREARRAGASASKTADRAATAADVAKHEEKLRAVEERIGRALDSLGRAGPLEEVLPLMPPDVRAAWVRRAINGSQPDSKGTTDGISMLLNAGMGNAIPDDLQTLVEYGLTRIPDSVIQDFHRWRELPEGSRAVRKFLQNVNTLFRSWFLSTPISIGNDFTGNYITYTVLGGYSHKSLQKHGQAFIQYASEQDEGVARLVRKLASKADYTVETIHGPMSIRALADEARRLELTSIKHQATERPEDVLSTLGRVGAGARSIRDNALALREISDSAPRFAVFVEEVSRGASFGDAASRARMLFPDYSDVTKFERNWARTFWMFYGYQRRMLPMVLRSILERPIRFKMLAMLTGLHANADNQDLPTWAREQAGLHLYDTEAGVPVFGALPGAVTNTLADLLEGNIFENLLRNANPLARGFAEYAMDRDFFTGQLIGFQEDNRAQAVMGRGATRAPSWLRYLPGAEEMFGFSPRVDRQGRITGYDMDPQWRWIFESALPLGQWSRTAEAVLMSDERKPGWQQAMSIGGVTTRTVPGGTPQAAMASRISKTRNQLTLQVLDIPGKPLTIQNGVVVPNRKTPLGQKLDQMLEEAELAAKGKADLYGYRGDERRAMIENARTTVFRAVYPEYSAMAEVLQRLSDAHSWLIRREDFVSQVARKSGAWGKVREDAENEKLMQLLGVR